MLSLRVPGRLQRAPSLLLTCSQPPCKAPHKNLLLSAIPTSSRHVNTTAVVDKQQGVDVQINNSIDALPASAVVFSGIQPTGVPHLGNYLGALRQWLRMQDAAPPSARLLFSIVDLHAITVAKPAALLARYRRKSIAALLSVGLRPDRCVMFWQSDIPEHSELMWILSCQASMGMLSRMTQWKDKSQKQGADKHQLGLFSYPVLQAADVLVHGATHVPVGQDQAQHLEFARYMARTFNHNFNTNVLTEPTTIISQTWVLAKPIIHTLTPSRPIIRSFYGVWLLKKHAPIYTQTSKLTNKSAPAKRIMSLTKPENKMSKSDPSPKSRVLITDSPEDIARKIRGAVTDMDSTRVTYEPDTRPGVSNLLEILASFTDSTCFTSAPAPAPASTSHSPSLLSSTSQCPSSADTHAHSETHHHHQLALQYPTIQALKSAVTVAIVQGLSGVRERYEDILTRDGGRYIEHVAEEGAASARQSAARTIRAVKEAVGMGCMRGAEKF